MMILAEQSQDGLTKNQNKKKINELLDKYGESKEAIYQHADIKDSFAYMFAKGDELIDEV